MFIKAVASFLIFFNYCLTVHMHLIHIFLLCHSVFVSDIFCKVFCCLIASLCLTHSAILFCLSCYMHVPTSFCTYFYCLTVYLYLLTWLYLSYAIHHSYLPFTYSYDILPSTTAVFSYTIKLSANEQFFVGAETVVNLLQTTQIKQDVSFIAADKVYTSTNKTTVVWIETELIFLPGVDASQVYVCALALDCLSSHVSTQTFRRVLTASLDSCTEIKSTPSVA